MDVVSTFALASSLSTLRKGTFHPTYDCQQPKEKATETR